MSRKPGKPLTRLYAALLALCLAGGAQAQELYAVLAGASQGADDAGSFALVNETDGTLTIIGVPVPGAGLTGLAFDASGRAYASTDQATLIEIDPTDGSLVRTVGTTSYSGTDFPLQDLAFDPVSGLLFGVSNNADPVEQDQLYVVSTTDATLTLRGSANDLPGGFNGIAFTSDGRLWGTNTSSELGEFDPADGSLIGTTSFSSGNGGPALGARLTDDLLFFAECCTGSQLLNDIGTLTTSGTATLLGPAGGTRRVHDFAWSTMAAPPPPPPPPPPPAPMVPVPVDAGLGLGLLMLLIGGLGLWTLARRGD